MAFGDLPFWHTRPLDGNPSAPTPIATPIVTAAFFRVILVGIVLLRPAARVMEWRQKPI